MEDEAEGTLVPGRSFQADVSLMLATRVASLLTAVATTVVVARALGPTGRGELVVAINLTILLVQFGTLGFQTANPYFVAQERTVRDQIVWNSVWLALILGSLLILVGLGLRVVAPSALQGIDLVELTVALSAIPAGLAAQFLQSVLLGEGRTVAYNLAELAVAIGTLIALIVGLVTYDVGVLGGIVIIATSRYVAALVFLVLARRSTVRAPDITLARRMLAYASRVYLATVIAFFVIRLDLLLVNGYLGPTQAGLYSVAVALADGLLVLPQVVSLNLFARVSRGLEVEQSAKVFRVVALVYGLVCVISIPFAGPAIDLLYGAAFADATPLFYWLVVGVFCLGMLTVLSQHFAGRGFPIQAALVWVIGLGINLAVNVAFLSTEGTYIASLASSVAYLVLLGLHARMFAREAGTYAVLVPRVSELSMLVPRRRA